MKGTDSLAWERGTRLGKWGKGEVRERDSEDRGEMGLPRKP